MTPKFVVITFFIISVAGKMVVAQNLDEVGLKKGIKFNGAVNLSAIGYATRGIDRQRDPFNWFATGSLNINFYGYNAPFSFSYSNTNRNFTQPFNQFSFTPQYKWVKAYVGYNSMTFSPYTLAGHVFFGGGVELSPGKWRIAALYGRFKKAVPFDVDDTLHYANAAFRRMGYGLKVGYESNGDAVSMNVFTAKDDARSLPFVLPQSQLMPKQNVAVSLSGRKKFLKRFFIEGEYAVSALNNNLKANAEEADTAMQRSSHNLIQGLLPENATSRYYDALRASLGFQGNWFLLQVRYERIAPEYQTLGAYYFNNDLRNITVAPTLRLLKSRLNLAFNGGLQQNNLDGSRTSTTKRFVGSCNATFTPTERWNFGANYSNFSSYTNLRPRQDPFYQNALDTLNFYQVSQTTSATVMRVLGRADKPQTLTLSGSYQQANDHASYDGGEQQSDFFNANLAYSYSLQPSRTTIAVAASLFTNHTGGMASGYWGPTVSVTSSLLKNKLLGSWSGAYNEASGSVVSSPVLNNRISLTFKPDAEKNTSKTSQALSCGINISNRLKGTEQQPAYAEFTCTLNYSYSF